jgi:hypothetical protein
MSAQVVRILTENPDLTDVQVAVLAGCSRTSLYRMAAFRKIREEQQAERKIRREVFKASLPRGFKTVNPVSDQPTTIEDYWDERQKTPLDILIEKEEEGDFEL